MKKKIIRHLVIIFFLFVSITNSFAEEEKEIISAREVAMDYTSEDEGADSSLEKVTLQEGKSKEIPARNITRHLSINPDIAITKKVSSDILSITGFKKGLTYIHVWDDDGRRTVRVNVEEKAKEEMVFAAAVKDTVSKIEVEIGGSTLISGKNITRYLSIDPGIVTAERISKETLSVTGIKYGWTFIHIWGDEGRRTISVAVRRKGFFEARERKKKLPQELKPFRASYSFDISNNSVKSDLSQHEYVDKRFSHIFSLNGETPWGEVDSRLQFRGRDDRVSRRDEDITYFNINLKNKDLEFTLGDKRINYSSLTLPYVRYQGVNLKASLGEKLDYDIVWGAEGQRLYGNRIIDQSLPNPYFSGLKTDFHVTEKLDLTTTFLRGKDAGDTISEQVVATGYKLDLDKINLRGEYAFGDDKDNIAWESEMRVNLHKMGFGAIYRDYDPEYKTVIGSVGNRGHKGIYLSFFHNPFDLIGISAYYDRFQNRYSPNRSEPGQDNVNTTVNLRLSPTSLTHLYISFWEKDTAGVYSPMNSEGVTGRISHRFDLGIRDISTYLEYTSRKFKSIPAPSIDFEDEKIAIGLSTNLIEKLRLSLLQEWNSRRKLEEGTETTPQRSVIALSYNSRIGQSPFYTMLAFKYEDKRNVGSSSGILADEDIISLDAKIRYRPSQDFEWFIKGGIDDVRGTSVNQRDRIKREVVTGIRCSWDTGFRVQTAGDISGVVYKDLNGNGIREKSEPGIPDVKIFLDQKISTITDKEGSYKFLKVKGLKASVLMDMQGVPSEYITTTSNPQKVMIAPGEVTKVDFGLTTKTQLRGVVFNDLNNNRQFDDEDIGMKNVLITIDTKRAITDLSGHYNIKDILPGEYYISLNTETLPQNFIPLVPSRQKIEIPEGQTYTHNFAIQALRTVMGTVFYDQNVNGAFDKGEEGISDVKIFLGSKVTLTNGDGAYIFKNLPAGVNEIKVDESTLPSQYYLKIPSDTLQLSVEGEVKRDINFGVEKR